MTPEPFFRLRPTPGGVWPPLPEPRFATIWAAYQTLGRTQWLPPDRVADLQLAQVREVLRHAIAHVPHYRRTLAGVRPDDIRTPADFRRLPLLQRATIRDLGPDLHADVLPAGIADGGEGRTSGTSGVPVVVKQTTRDQYWWLAFYLRDLEWADLDPRRTLAGFRPIKPKTPQEAEALANGAVSAHWLPLLGPLIESGPAHLMDLRQPIDRQLGWLRRVNPDYLLGYPSHLDLLAATGAEKLPNLTKIQVIAEPLAPAVRGRIEAAFGAPVVDLYSCSEAGYLASPCPAGGGGLHVHAENVLLEVLDDAGNPCGPGEFGRVVVTTLHNFRMPFVRYDILDGAVAGGPCPCGRGLPLLLRIDGKLRPYFDRPDGGKRSTTQLSQAFQNVPGLVQYQVTQRASGRLHVRLVPGREWEPSAVELVRAAIDEFLGAAGLADIEIMTEIPRPPSGKLRDFVREEPAAPAAPLHSPPAPAVHTTSCSGKTILLGWELGGGFGHVKPLIALAAALADDGHFPVFALKDIVGTGPVTRDLPWPVLLAPNWSMGPAPDGKGYHAASFGDILALHGYASEAVLAPLLGGWDGLLDAVRPDLVVCEYAPSLALAAAGRVPVIDVGNGFCLPPIHLPEFPVVFPDRPRIFPEAGTLAVVRAVLKARGRPEPETLPAAFVGPVRCSATFPDLDPYRAIRREPCVGPLDPVPPVLPQPAGSRFFAYLAADSQSTEPALKLLASAGFAGEVFVRGGSDELKARLRATGLTVHDRPAAVGDALARCGVLIHPGGLSMAAAALAAGRPQLLLPIHGENLLNAVAVHRLGVAHYLVGEIPAADILEGVRQLFHDPKFARRAVEVAEGVHRAGLCDGVAAVRARCRELLAGV